ncbi:unnamed protein product [Rotaria sp. Silwood1]|nr:unnamed protein product [Rotaria sp. Silwood1]
MKSFSVNRQLITSTIKPNKEGEETAAAEGIIDLVEDADESAANIYENLKAAIKKAGLHLEEKIEHFGNGIEDLTWKQIQKCIEVTKIQGLNEDNLFNEFTELNLTFEATKKKEAPLVDQIQFFLSNAAEKEIHNSSTTTMRQTEVDEEV